MHLPALTLRPAKRYRYKNGRWRTIRGARRHDTIRGRALALFDTLGVTKRGNEVRICISTEALLMLADEAAKHEQSPSALASYFVEAKLRGMMA